MKSYPGEDKVKRLLLNHQWDDAKRLLEEVFTVSDTSGALNDLALICSRTGEWKRALELMELAMKKPDRDIRTDVNYFYISELSGLNRSRGEDARSRVLELKVGDESYEPKLSIVMRTFNRGALIKEAIRSVFEQSFKDWELIIVNDGGDKDVEKTLESIWDRRMVYAYARHSGPAGSFNVGLRLARGAMLGFLDDDDYVYPDHWARLMSHMERHPESNAVYSDINLVWLDLKTGRIKRIKSHQAGEFKREKLWTGFYLMNLLTMVIRRECLKRMPGFLEGLRSAVDWEFMLALSHYINFDYISKPAGELRYWEGLSQVGKRSVIDRNHQRNLVLYYHGITPFYRFTLGKNTLDEKFLQLLDRLLQKYPELMRGLEMRKLLNEHPYSVFYQLGSELLKQGNKQEARQCLHCARALAPKEIKVLIKLLWSYLG